MAQGLYLSQKMSLQQVLAPQLQQSLALLHAPTLELQAMIQQELNDNVTLEGFTPDYNYAAAFGLDGDHEAPMIGCEVDETSDDFGTRSAMLWTLKPARLSVPASERFAP